MSLYGAGETTVPVSATFWVPLCYTGLGSDFGISEGISLLTAWDFVVDIACLDYRLRISQPICLCLQRMCLT